MEHMETPPRAVIFDLDGTLADTFEMIVAAWNEAMKEPTGRHYTPEEVIARFGLPESAMIRNELSDQPEEVSRRAVEHFVAVYEREHGVVEPFDGIPELLETLHRRGIPMGVVTGKGSDTLEITIRLLGWAPYFGSLVSGDDVVNPKPDPEGPIKAAHELGVEPAGCVFIGDSPADITAGNKAGMPTIAAGWHTVYTDVLREAGPTFWAGSPADVGVILGLEEDALPR